MEERRKTLRQRSYLGAHISFDAHCPTMDCTVRNLSQKGARVAFTGATLLPQEFDISIRQRSLNARARVVWRYEGEMGLSFLKVSSEPEEGSIDLARRVRKLEAEKRQLKLRLSELTGDYLP